MKYEMREWLKKVTFETIIAVAISSIFLILCNMLFLVIPLTAIIFLTLLFRSQIDWKAVLEERKAKEKVGL